MLTTLKNAFKIKEIRQKILFTLGMLVVIRIGSQLPVPGVDTKFFSQWFAQQTGGAFSFFDAITGGSFLNRRYVETSYRGVFGRADPDKRSKDRQRFDTSGVESCR